MPSSGRPWRSTRRLGPGFYEKVYQRALSFELGARGLPHRMEVGVPVHYRGAEVGTFRADLLCDGGVLVELKAVASLEDMHGSQVINYLRATGCSRGPLINFGGPSLQFRRYVHSKPQVVLIRSWMRKT